jgi:hypothetical protein
VQAAGSLSIIEYELEYAAHLQGAKPRPERILPTAGRHDRASITA